MCKLYVSFARRQPLVQRAVTGLGDRQPSQPTHARTASSEFSALRVSVSRCTECTTRVVKTYNEQPLVSSAISTALAGEQQGNQLAAKSRRHDAKRCGRARLSPHLMPLGMRICDHTIMNHVSASCMPMRRGSTYSPLSNFPVKAFASIRTAPTRDRISAQMFFHHQSSTSTPHGRTENAVAPGFPYRGSQWLLLAE